MYKTIDGRLATTLNGRFTETKVDTLTYMVQGNHFPLNSQNSGVARMFFESNEPQKLTVNWGDGTSDVYDMVLVEDVYRIGWSSDNSEYSPLPFNSRKPKHDYVDGSEAIRAVSFKFEKPLAVSYIYSERVEIHGKYPANIGAFTNLNRFYCAYSKFITGVPKSLSKCQKLETLIYRFNGQEREMKVPDEFFDLVSLKELQLSNSYDLSDVISSNFFKINQLINLRILNLSGCLIEELPNEFGQLDVLITLRLKDNNLQEYPIEIAGFEYIDRLKLGFDSTMTTVLEWGDLANYKGTRYFGFQYNNFNFQSIPQAWMYLYSLSQINDFEKLVDTDARFDEFVNVFYELITNEASITSGGSAAPYPNRFRDIAWGDTSLAFSGIYEAPSGYIQGVSNGNPVTEGQRVFVLIEQYGHTVTSAN